MKKRYSIAVKAVAVCVFAVTMTVAILGAGAVAYMLEDGYYNTVPVPFAESGLCYRQAQKYSETAFYSYFQAREDNGADSGAAKTYEDYFSATKTNYAFRITPASGGDTLLDTYGDDERFVFVTSFSYYGQSRLYSLEAYIDPGLPVDTDGFYAASQTYGWLLRGKYNIPVLTVAFGLVALVAFIYLMSAAGHRADTEPEVITLTWFDRIPLDILAAAALVAGAFLTELVLYFNYYAESLILAIAAAMFLIAMAALAFCVTFAARVKKGGWYKNTVVYIVARALWRTLKALCYGIGDILRNLPLVWKTALFWGGLCFFNMICMFVGGLGGFFWWFAVNAAVGIAACFVTIWAHDLQKGGEAIAHGDLSYHVDTSKMKWDFKCHGEALNNISIGMGRAVEEHIKSEHFKTELITNVSHDLKTPLTSIINYVDLLEKRDIDDEQAKEYIKVLERQSARLKKLTEDLVEASKASTGSITVEPARTDVTELLNQAVSEYSDKLDAAGIETLIHAPEDGVYIYADGRLLWRVFDNLLGNICKYSQRGTRAYVDVEKDADRVTIVFKNISNYQLNINADELMERFVRGDTSRHTEGSGLGLSIAKSLTELQKGSFSLVVDGDLFKAIVGFAIMRGEDKSGRAGTEDDENTKKQPEKTQTAAVM